MADPTSKNLPVKATVTVDNLGGGIFVVNSGDPVVGTTAMHELLDEKLGIEHKQRPPKKKEQPATAAAPANKASK